MTLNCIMTADARYLCGSWASCSYGWCRLLLAEVTVQWHALATPKSGPRHLLPF